MTGKCTKVILIALFNLVILYYVVSKLSVDDDKKYATKFQTRLPKDSQQVEDQTDQADQAVNEVIDTNEETTRFNLLVESMKNKLYSQTHKNVTNIENEKDITTTHNSLIDSMKNRLFGLKDDHETIETETIDEELKKRLEDSSEIELITQKPKIVLPVLGPKPQVLKTSDDFQSLMQQRRSTLDDHCNNVQHSNNVISSHVNTNVLYVLKSHSLVWCPVYKAASTNWCHNLLLLAGKTTQQIQTIMKKYPNQPNDQARVVAPLTSDAGVRDLVTRDDASSLLIVRHPFDRLVSAFRDKLEQCHGVPGNCTLSSNWYYKQYGHKIVNQFRDRAVQRFGQEFFSQRNNYGAPFPVSRSWRDQHYPSWWEFIQYLLNTNTHSYDEHWKPASVYCSVCGNIKYNKILHFENIVNEEPHLAESLGAGDLIKPRWENKNSKEKVSKEQLLGSYFSLLSDQEIQRLYKIYEDDFRAFGYKFRFRNFVYG